MFTGLTHLISKLKRTSKNYGLMGLLFVLVIGILFSVEFRNPYHMLSVGEPSKSTIYATRSIRFQSQEDQKKTQALIQKQKDSNQDIYSIDSAQNTAIRQRFIGLFSDIQAAKNDADYQTPFMTNYRRSILLKSKEASLKRLEFLGLQQLDILLSSGIKSIDKVALGKQIKDNLSFSRLSNFEKITLRLFIAQIIKPNMFLDESKTQKQLSLKLASIVPLTSIITKGDLLVSEGEPITPKTYEILQIIQEKNVQFNTFYFGGLLLLTSLLFALGTFKIRHALLKTQRLFEIELLFVILSVFILIVARALLFIKWPLDSINALFAIPIPIIAFLSSILFSYAVALSLGLILSLLVSLMFEPSSFATVFLLLAHLASCLITQNIKRRLDIIRCGHFIGLALIGCGVAIGLLQGIYSLNWYLWVSAICYVNGLLCAFLTLVVLPYLENLFKNTSSLSMIENYNLNHPLMKKMLIQAPGTYHHSLMVAHLAESAAQSIGADDLLCRIASYFHDIGKLNRPQFYIENQEDDENPHENLSPKMSKLIIAAHTKDGASLAKEHQLPSAIIQIILSHHGTSLVSFFYQQAKEKATKDDPDAKDYRYDGPKPISKEEGIVMLADSIEAATRSLKEPSPSKIDALIESIIEDKIADQQLHDCRLTLSEIKRIKKSITKQLVSSKHKRIDYQDALRA